MNSRDYYAKPIISRHIPLVLYVKNKETSPTNFTAVTIEILAKRMSRILTFGSLSMLFGLLLGCGLIPTVEDEPAMEERVGPLPNPIVVQVQDREFFWNTLVDTVDDYFEIASEQRVQLVGNMLTEGHILSKNKLGSNIAEIWQKDSTPSFERWQSTFQPIRRRAELRVSPETGGYAVQVTVFKELEDTDRPEEAAVGKNLRRHDGSLVKQAGANRSRPVQLGWIPKGRDTSLEQTILADISARFHQVQMPPDIQLLPPIHDPLDVLP